MGLWICQIATWAKIGLKHTFAYAVLAIVSCTILFFPSFISDCKEIEVRWLGLGFQIVGILVVLWQLRWSSKALSKTFLSFDHKKVLATLPIQTHEEHQPFGAFLSWRTYGECKN